ncbi:MAG: preprotein translocase subunit YajC [Solirubrobacteraceae bacterium]|jgi:preprotein translocase subunit YajC
MITSTFLQAASGTNSSIPTFIMMGLMFVVFYFFIIRPQSKKQNDQKTFQENLKQGQKVVTTSGIHGRISQVNDITVVVDTGAGKITFEKTAVSKEITELRDKV